MPSYRTLLAAAAKGGVGKSTTALSLAAAFARLGERVLLCDLDGTGRSLDMLAGVSDKAVLDTSDLVRGIRAARRSGESISDLIGKYTVDCTSFASRAGRDDVHGGKLCLIPAAPRSEFCAEEDGDGNKSHLSAVREICGSARECAGEGGPFDRVIFDTGGGIAEAEAAAPEADMIIVTSDQSKTSIRAAEYAGMRFFDAVSREKCPADIRLAVCSFDIASVKREHRAGVIEMIDSSSLACIGVVPFDKKLRRAQDEGRLSESISLDAYLNIARRIKGENVPLFSGMPGMRRRVKKAL